MPGNRAHFQEAMQRANDAVWAEQWKDAAEAYQSALREFPNNASALLGYAWTLLNLHDLDAALETYQQITKITPNDPGPFERIGDILKTKGQRNKAINAYQSAADRYAKQKVITKQTSSLEAIIDIAPHDADVWAKLLDLYKEQHLIDQAVLATLWVCFLLQDSDTGRAIDTLNDMQEFIPHNSQIQNTLNALQRHHSLPEPPQLGAIDQLEMMNADMDMDEKGGDVSPIDHAQKRALEQLAEAIFDEDLPQATGMQDDQVRLLISKAVNAHTRGEMDNAIRTYEQLLNAKMNLPSIQFGLGLLYHDKGRYTDTLRVLHTTTSDADYGLASQILSAGCYRALGQDKDALQTFVDAVQTLDLMYVSPEYAEALSRIYEGIAPSLYDTSKPEHNQQIIENLADFLNSGDWNSRAKDARRRLDELAKLGFVFSMVELVILPERNSIMRGMAITQEDLRRGRVRAAIEEAMHTISLEPRYLPPHHLLANLLLETNQIEETIEKYQALAKTYEIRGQLSQALITYNKMIEISPLDIDVQQRAADLQIKRGNHDAALELYLQIAEAHYQLAQPEFARETYLKAMKLAPMCSPERHWEIRILHKMADLDMQRLDWQSAIDDNEEILRRDPNDQRAHLALYRLYPRTGRDQLAINVLDKLIRSYLEQRKYMPALTMLEDLIMEDPDSIPLRARIAQLYMNTGKRDRALEHLDVLGDLQLEAGLNDGAMKTIDAIIRLKPDNVSAYEELYRSLANGKSPRTTR